jgi:hypothetical protein
MEQTYSGAPRVASRVRVVGSNPADPTIGETDPFPRRILYGIELTTILTVTTSSRPCSRIRLALGQPGSTYYVFAGQQALQRRLFGLFLLAYIQTPSAPNIFFRQGFPDVLTSACRARVLLCKQLAWRAYCQAAFSLRKILLCSGLVSRVHQ